MPVTNYHQKLARDRKASDTASRRGRDIASTYPLAGDLERRARCERDFKLYLENYHREAFPLPWSPDHLRLIEAVQVTILEGGLLAIAFPRGAGKSTIVVRGALWAMLYGHRRFVVPVGATERHAERLLRVIRSELRYNELLASDHRQATHGIRALEGEARRAPGQHFGGLATEVEWKNDRLTLPRIPAEALDGADVGGATVVTAGLTGAIRGLSITRPDGTVLRPDLILLDDPSTRESAQSPSQNDDRLRIVRADVLGLAAPGSKLAALAAVTVVAPNDLADVLTDRKRSPEWNGQKAKTIYSFPSNMKLWDEYAIARGEGLRAGDRGAAGNAFYEANRAAMDEGARVGWPERFDADELSAIQSAMNLKIRDEFAFASEYQNEPLSGADDESPILTPEAIMAKAAGTERGLVPAGAQHVVGFIDVHDELLYYAVGAWTPQFSGRSIDYGTWPDQGLDYFTMRKAPRPLSLLYPGLGTDGAISRGLEDLANELLSREWPSEDGPPLRMGRLLIDSGHKPALIADVVRRSQFAALMTPSRGVGITAGARPMSEYDRTKGDDIRFNMYLAKATDNASPRTLRHDANFWRTFLFSRLRAAFGDPGCLSLFGDRPDRHRLLADHLNAEYAKQTFGSGRWLWEWRPKPARPDNHWFDCFTGLCVAASYQGSILPGSGVEAPAAKKKRVLLTIDELKARYRAG